MFNIGEQVETLDDSLKGTVLKIKNGIYTIATEDGFELEYSESELVPIADRNQILEASKMSAIESAKNEKVFINHHRVNTEKKSRKEEFVLEIDLHIEKLVKDYSKLTNFDILNIQVDTARGQLEFAIKNRIPRIVFIHGMGEGVLKTELEYLFGRYSEVTFQDANYKKYGLGATEVHLIQKKLSLE